MKRTERERENGKRRLSLIDGEEKKERREKNAAAGRPAEGRETARICKSQKGGRTDGGDDSCLSNQELGTGPKERRIERAEARFLASLVKEKTRPK